MKVKYYFFSVLIFLLFNSNSIDAQYKLKRDFQMCKYVDGYWGEWFGNWSMMKLYINYDKGEILFVDNGYHPSAWTARVKIYNFALRSFKKKDYRSLYQYVNDKDWYSFTGSIEIRLDKKSSLKQWIADFPYASVGGEVIFRTCKILIHKFRRRPKCFNFIFDDYGIGVNF